jgi:hypothetical protein
MTENPISSRDLLNIALGDKKVETLENIGTDTFLDYLPKDVIEYLHNYTEGLLDCYYVIRHLYDGYGRRDEIVYAWVNHTQQYVNDRIRQNVGYYGYSIPLYGQIIFIDGKPHLVRSIKKTNLYGMPKPKKIKKTQDSKSLKPSVKCIGKTKSGKRCKHRISNIDRLCAIHK